ncbi:MAG: hypothetical protein HOC74_17360 [Gemmatimonadetes bacterium]|jgi:hypothetical protein|nr:hypothetical protein [Gemmatimonadota bacterium]
MEKGEIRLKNETLAPLDRYVLTRGVPLPPGAVKSAAGVSVVDARGRVLPSTAKILQHRPDGSVEWMLMDILLKLRGEQEKSIYVVPRSAAKPVVRNPVVVSRDGKEITLDNGVSAVTVSKAGGSLIKRLVVNGRVLVDETMVVDLQVVDGGGKIHRASLNGSYKVSVTHKSPLRTEVMIEGKHRARGNATFMDFALRLTLTANSPDIKLEHTFYCREPRDGRLPIRSICLVMPTTMDGGAGKLLRQCRHGQESFHRDVEIRENVEVVASSVDDIDSYAQSTIGASVSHPSAGGSVFLRNLDSLKEDWSEYPHYMRPDGGPRFRADLLVGGMRQVWPIIGWQEDGFTVATTFEHFRQLYPKSIEIDENVVTYSIWPKWSFPMEVVQGVSKSHVLWITGAPRQMSMDGLSDVLGRWEYDYVEPVDASFDPAWPAYCEVMDCHRIFEYQPKKYPLLENRIEVAPSEDNPERHTYGRQPARGMFDFGDTISFCGFGTNNNEDDIEVCFPLQDFLRSGNTYCWDYGKEAARHYMEVDFCAWSTDPGQHGGLIAHTIKHFVGNVYPSHQWVEGILAYYYLSGDDRARKVVESVGDNHVWWAENRIESFNDGREAGVPLVNLAAVYHLTRDEKYIDAAWRIIDAFVLKAEAKYGEFKYPFPQSSPDHPQKLITGYGDWSTFSGLFRLWEQTGDEEFRKLAVRLLDKAMRPENFLVNDPRAMDFFGAWAFGVMIGDMDEVIRRVAGAVPMLLRRGGHQMRRLHFLRELDIRGMIDERDVGTP